MTKPEDPTNPPPPTPNPLNAGINRYPLPADGTPNIPLLKATHDLIRSLPRRGVSFDPAARDADSDGWTQEEWRCATGMCFAGWAAALTGAVFPYPVVPGNDDGSVWVNDGTFMAKSMVVRDADGTLWDIQGYARHMLGLSSLDYLSDVSDNLTDDLFAPYNTLNDIDDIVDIVIDATQNQGGNR